MPRNYPASELMSSCFRGPVAPTNLSSGRLSSPNFVLSLATGAVTRVTAEAVAIIRSGATAAIVSAASEAVAIEVSKSCMRRCVKANYSAGNSQGEHGNFKKLFHGVVLLSAE